ncbi:MAG: protein-(glutamine-N5) methyltransferase, release factor-specific [Rhodobacterales bacterium]|nr:MAG: protein-(glutamine-N5) methyltransferase, release factor-specific [Rhodobacterales bacterium]
MIAAQVLAAAVELLQRAGVADAANDARILLAHALEIERSRLILHLDQDLPASAQARFQTSIAARCNRQPVAQIIGQRSFYGRDFFVTPDVLDPRPETELLIETALRFPFETVLDLGTGSGCILLTLLAEKQHCRGVGADISAAALSICNKNAQHLGVSLRCELLQSDWFSQLSGRFDLIVSNPPYIAADEMPTLAPELRDWEPQIALSPGGDGLVAYRVLTQTAPRFLNPKGRLMVEIGHQQGADVCDLFQANGFHGITCLKDLNGHDRVVLGQIG